MANADRSETVGWHIPDLSTPNSFCRRRDLAKWLAGIEMFEAFDVAGLQAVCMRRQQFERFCLPTDRVVELPRFGKSGSQRGQGVWALPVGQLTGFRSVCDGLDSIPESRFG